MDNVLITQELIRLYNRKAASPRCLIQLDLREFIREMLQGFRFVILRPKKGIEKPTGLSYPPFFMKKSLPSKPSKVVPLVVKA